ncbi:hypothetical protein [Pontibacillus salipaludis]|uniref:hypothetical protein n=1 Tax=Pontibacillus salipaludis TaxID=1697394 RepID=UPI0031EABA5F
MDAYEILEIYKKRCSTKALIFSDIRKVTLVVVGVFSTLFFLLFNYYILIQEELKGFLVFIIFILSSLYLIHNLNKEYKRVLNEKYDIFSENYLWNSLEFKKLKLNKLEEELENEEIIGKEKIQYLIELSEEAQEDLKAPYWLNKGVFISVALPVWIQFLSWTYKNEINNSNEALLFFSVIIIVLVLFFFFIGTVKGFFNEVFSSYSKMKNLTFDLKSIYLSKLNND